MRRVIRPQGDTGRPLNVQLLTDGQPNDTSAWSNLRVRICAAGVPATNLVDEPVTKLDPNADGWVQYAWALTDTSQYANALLHPVGTYWIRIVGTNPEGRPESFPGQDEYIELVITDQIAAASP